MQNYGVKIIDDKSAPDYLTTSLLSMFPAITCLTPQKALLNMKTDQISKSSI